MTYPPPKNRTNQKYGSFEGNDGKTATYTLNMAYDNMHNIISKKQDMTQTNLQFAGSLYAGYDLKYDYADNSQQIRNIADSSYRRADNDSIAPVIVKRNYGYDANGNLTYIATGKQLNGDSTTLQATGLRKLLWDEENRLQAINDNGFVSNYWYDASGERAVKMSAENEGVFVNGVQAAEKMSNAKFTAYISPYMVVNSGGWYSKHIYMGSQRIASKLGNSGMFTDRNPLTDTTAYERNYSPKLENLTKGIKTRYDSLGVEYPGTPSTAGLVNSSPGNTTQSYFYHSDHLGSSSVITDQLGTLVQHVEYVPFGEVFVEERASASSWQTPYLFNAKELDEETGLYYYGARYYDPRTSVWLSVDPLAEKKPWMSSYVYCSNNPTNRVDPDGREDRSGKRSTINKTNGVPTSPQSSVRINEPKVEVKPIRYTQPIITGEIRDANKVKMQEQHNFAMSTEINKACLTNPVLRAEAVGGLTVTATALAPELIKDGILTGKTLAGKTLPLVHKVAQIALNNPKATETVVGVGIGIFNSVASGNSQDAPLIITGIPQVDNASTKAQFFMTVGTFVQYVASGGSQTQASDSAKASDKKPKK